MMRFTGWVTASPPILTIDFTRTEHAAMVADAFGVES